MDFSLLGETLKAPAWHDRSMTVPALAHATEFGRMYARQLGQEPLVPSITTVIGMQATDMEGWIGYMAAKNLANHKQLPAAMAKKTAMSSLIQEAAAAAREYREAAAARGDRLHSYAEHKALAQLGAPHELAAAREKLDHAGESGYAHSLDQWWEAFDVQPISAETTVWNHTLGYAGTIDLVARIAGRLCLIDYKTKGANRYGHLPPLDSKVVTQLVAAYKGEECLVDAAAGQWRPCDFQEEPLLIAVAIGEGQSVPQRANPAALRHHWHKFCALHRLWVRNRDAQQAGAALSPLPPPQCPAVPTPVAVAQ